MPRPTGRACRGALIAPMPCADQAELLRAFDLPIALMQDADALERIAARARRDEGRRRRPLRRDPLGPAAPRRRAASRSTTGSRPSARGARPRPRDRDDGPTDLHRPALPRPGGERRARRDRRPVPRPRPDRLGPRRAGGGLPGPAGSTRGRSRPPGPAACGSRSTPGEWGGAAQVRRALAMDPERIAHGPGAVDDPALCAELHDAGRVARPLPDLELAGRDRAERRRPPARRGCTGPACR